MLVSYLQAFCFLSSTFFLPNWWQSVKGVRPVEFPPCSIHRLTSPDAAHAGQRDHVGRLHAQLLPHGLGRIECVSLPSCTLSLLLTKSPVVPTGWYISKYGNVSWVIRIGYSVGAIGADSTRRRTR